MRYCLSLDLSGGGCGIWHRITDLHSCGVPSACGRQGLALLVALRPLTQGATFHTVPKLPGPPTLVVPYRFPLASRITFPHGAAPSVNESNMWSIVILPVRLSLKTVPHCDELLHPVLPNSAIFAEPPTHRTKTMIFRRIRLTTRSAKWVRHRISGATFLMPRGQWTFRSPSPRS
jgi:hypothetical protein